MTSEKSLTQSTNASKTVRCIDMQREFYSPLCHLLVRKIVKVESFVDMGTENISHYLCTGEHSGISEADVQLFVLCKRKECSRKQMEGEREREREIESGCFVARDVR